jgi:hypothetical protein
MSEEKCLLSSVLLMLEIIGALALITLLYLSCCKYAKMFLFCTKSSNVQRHDRGRVDGRRTDLTQTALTLNNLTH